MNVWQSQHSNNMARLSLILVTFIQSLHVCKSQTGGTITYRLAEEGSVGDRIGSIVTDANLDTKYSIEALALLRFRFLTDASIPVVIGSDSGFLATSGRIDRENIEGCRRSESCRVTIDVAVQPQQFFQIIKVVIEILDVNDYSPQFDQTVFEHSMKESTSVGNMFVVPSAVDSDSPQYGIQRYQLRPENEEDEQLFALRVIPNADGTKRVKLQLVRKLDRELSDRYVMTLEAIDGGQPPKSGSLEIIINVLDSNDHHPLFQNSSYEVTVPEDIAIEAMVLQVKALDEDIGENGRIQYSLSPQTLIEFGDVFGIESNSGKIYTLSEMDHERKNLYNLIVTAQDMGPDSQPTDTNVVVHVEDINDNAPTIIVNTLTASGTNRADIPEDSPVGTFVAHLTVTDADSGLNGEFGCKLNDNAFRLQSTEYRTEYQILTTVVMDREKMPQYSLALHCEDFGAKPLGTTQHIQVDVADINDHYPTFQEASYTADIIENNYLGAKVLELNATDEDKGKNSEIVYSLSNNVADVFAINQHTGSITAKTQINRENTSQYRFYVMATDQGDPPLSASVSVVVTVEDVNDEGPQFTKQSYSFTVDENEDPGTTVGVVSAIDKDTHPYDQFLFSFVQGSSYAKSFMIDPKSGKIMTIGSLDREREPVYHFIIVAKDTNAPNRFSSTASVTIYVRDVNDHEPAFVYPTKFNNTIYMSNKVPIGYNITQIRTHDPDNGPNGKVSYTIQSGNAENIFYIDEDSGILSTNVAFTRVDYKLSRLQIAAMDHGTPQLIEHADLTIVVNKSIPYVPPGSAHQGILSNQNLLIVISVACGCAVIVVILIVAIVCIRRQDKVNRTQRYNCRMEAIGRMAAKEVMSHETEKVKDQSIPLPIPDKEGTLKAKDSYYCEVRKERLATPSPKVIKKMSHDLPAPLHRDLDQLSIHSNEGSNTDSGRGPSEEGEGGARHAISPNAPQRSTHSSLGQYSTPAYSNYYPHLKAHAAAHSYSSRPPQKLRSFAPEDEEDGTGRTQTERGYEPVKTSDAANSPPPYARAARILPAHGHAGYASRSELRNNNVGVQDNRHGNHGVRHGNGAIHTSEDHNANTRTPTHHPSTPSCDRTPKGLVV